MHTAGLLYSILNAPSRAAVLILDAHSRAAVVHPQCTQQGCCTRSSMHPEGLLYTDLHAPSRAAVYRPPCTRAAVLIIHTPTRAAVLHPPCTLQCYCTPACTCPPFLQIKLTQAEPAARKHFKLISISCRL